MIISSIVAFISSTQIKADNENIKNIITFTLGLILLITLESVLINTLLISVRNSRKLRKEQFHELLKILLVYKMGEQ